MMSLALAGASGCSLTNLCGAIPSIGGAAGNTIANAAAGAVLSAVVSDLTSAATWLISHVVQLILAPGDVALRAPWFLERTKVMMQLAGFVVGPLLGAATIGPVLRQDLRRLARVWGVGLPVALVAGALTVQLAQLALGVTDALTSAILGTSASSLAGQLDGLARALVTPGPPQLVVALISLLLIIGSILLWMEMVVRAAAIYVAVFFTPLALACYVWPATVSIAKRTVELLVALILSKFVIVATLTLGAAALAGEPSTDNAIVGAAILLLAAFAPFAVLRLAPIVEAGAIAHLEGMGRRPARAVTRAATAAVAAPSSPVAGLLLSARSRGGDRPGPTSVTAQRLPSRPADYPAETPAGVGHG